MSERESVERDGGFDAVHADTLRFFPELVRELGGDPAHLLLEVGLHRNCLSSGRPVGYRAIATLMEQAATRLRCPDFGLRLATMQGGGSVFGALGVVMRNAATLGDGLTYVVGHSHAHSAAARLHMATDPSRRRVVVGHDVLVDRMPVNRQAMEQFLLLAHLNAIEITGGKAGVRQALFRFQPLSSPSTYRRHFGCEVRFEQPVNGVVFSDADLQCPTVHPDSQLFSKATTFIEANFPRVEAPLRVRVRAVILQLIERSSCNKERVARELRMHPRTLHRRLRADGTCFEEIKDGVRRDIALGYLHTTGLSLQRIAEKVGYSEHSVLTRSFSRWFAASPREVRRNRHAHT